MSKWKIAAILTLLSLGCVRSKTEKVSEKLVSGIWIMQDSDKMAAFVDYGKVPKSGYCVKLDVAKEKATIQFVDSNSKIEMGLKKLKENNYQLEYKGRQRNFMLRKGDGDGEFWNFDDSKPFNPKETWQRDGEKSLHKTLSECVKISREEDSFSQEQQKEGPMGNFTPPEKQEAK